MGFFKKVGGFLKKNVGKLVGIGTAIATGGLSAGFTALSGIAKGAVKKAATKASSPASVQTKSAQIAGGGAVVDNIQRSISEYDARNSNSPVYGGSTSGDTDKFLKYGLIGAAVLAVLKSLKII